MENNFGQYFIYSNDKLVAILRPKYTPEYIDWVGKLVFGSSTKFGHWYLSNLPYYGKRPFDMSDEEIFHILMKIEFGIYV